MSTGAESIGSVAGAGLGLVVAGPPGALLGALLAPISTALIKSGIEALRSRISRREEVRTGTILYVATATIKAKLDAGKSIRSDGFFETKINDRTSAEEVIEAAILASQKSFEERKIPFIGRLVASIALDEAISPPEANHLIRLAERLSYRQLCLISVFALNEISPDLVKLRTETFPDGTYSPSFLSIIIELWDLYRETLIIGEGVQVSWLHIKLSQLRLVGLGATLYNSMELRNIPSADIDIILNTLKTGIPQLPASK